LQNEHFRNFIEVCFTGSESTIILSEGGFDTTQIPSYSGGGRRYRTDLVTNLARIRRSPLLPPIIKFLRLPAGSWCLERASFNKPYFTLKPVPGFRRHRYLGLKPSVYLKKNWCALMESNHLPTSHLIMATVLQTASGDKTHIIADTC